MKNNQNKQKYAQKTASAMGKTVKFVAFLHEVLYPKSHSS